MKILHKYVLKEHAGPLTFALTALTSILLLNYVAKQFGTLVGKGLPWTVIGEFFALSIPFTVALTFPMAVLVATLYAYSRLAADNEITAIKASGIGMVNVLTPVLLAAVVVTIGMLLFNDQVLPKTNHALAMLQTDIAQTKPTFALREQVINEVTPGKFYLRANHIEQGSNWMREVTIYDLTDPTKRRTIYADSGTLAMASNHADLLMVLYSGMMEDIPTADRLQLQRLFFQRDAIRIAGVANQFQKSTTDQGKGNREMSVCEMQRDVDKARQDYQRAQDILQTGIQRAEMFHVKLDTSLTHLRFSRPSRVTLGGVYCTLLGKVIKQKSDTNTTPTPPHVPLPQVHPQPAPSARPLPVTPPVTPRTIPRVTPPPALVHPPAMATPKPLPIPQPKPPITKPGSVATKRLPKRPLPIPGQAQRHFPNAPLKPVPHFPRPYPYPGAPGRPSPVFPRAPLPPNGRPGHPLPPQALQMLRQQEQQQAMMMQQQQGVIPTGLDAERMRLADLQLLIDSNEVEIHKKFALAVACFVFVLLGAPIALRFPRAGVGLTIGVSLFVFALYYVGLIAGASLGTRGIIPPWISMWAPNVIFGAVGVILVGRMNKQGGSVRSGGTWEWLDTALTWVKRRVFGVQNAQRSPTA